MLLTLAASTSYAAGTGGAGTPVTPIVRAVKCASSQASSCPGGKVVRGSEAILRGSNLEAVTSVVFRGHRTPGDDVTAKPSGSSPRTIRIRVPERAHAGRLALLDRYGGRSTMRRRFALLESYAKPLTPKGGQSLFFYDAERQPTFTFTARVAGAARVEVVDVRTGASVADWAVQLTPGSPQTLTWDGQAAGKPAPRGTYRFRFADTARALLSAAPESEDPFQLADHRFPIAGAHDLGQTPTNGFAGGRNHKGQDMFARCGTRLVAARGGRVEFAGYHAAAGNYVVIDGARTGVDYVYMHMLRAPLVRTGQRVRTGSQLGQVGETGRATGCHLHLEMWSAPGWYSGGSPYDPLPSLREWDAYS